MLIMVVIWVIFNVIGWKMIIYKIFYFMVDRDIISVGKIIKLIVRVFVWKFNY